MRLFDRILTLRNRRTASTAVCVAALLVAGGQTQKPEPSLATIGARAFVITDAEALAPFTFERVIRALRLAQSAEWLEATQIGFESRRRVILPLAGFTASTDPGSWQLTGTQEWSYVKPIAIVNRFDLAPADYRNCGEYRLIFSRRANRRSRLNIAIEIALPNPDQRKQKEGCATVAAFWWNLAHVESNADRRDQLERLFFEGLPGLPAVLDDQTFEASGRIRTSLISAGRPTFAQFEMRNACASSQPCAPRLTRVPLDNMPDAAFFDATITGEHASSFRREFVRQVASLSIPDVNRYSMNIDRVYSVRSVDALVPVFNYQLPFRRAQGARAGREFAQAIAEELRKVGSPLTPQDVIGRAETQNCMGCHGKPGPVGGALEFPAAFEQGEHLVAESISENARLSPALRDVFLPYRINMLENYLQAVAQTKVRKHQNQKEGRR